MKTTASIALLLAAVATDAVPARAQSDGAAKPDSAPLFTSLEPVQMTLRAPFKELFKDKNKDEVEAQPAQLTYVLNGQPTTLDLQIELRGKTRRRKCRFPPIRLNFPKKDVAGTLFAGQNKLKLVVQCDPRKDEYQQYLLLEYLIYRSYNQLTDKSYKVRLLDMTFEDTDGEEAPISNTAFLIEDTDHLAARVGLAELKVPAVPPSYMDPEGLTLLEVFQYMIGHTDWSAFASAPDESDCCHNTKVIGDPAGPVWSVPYDFDYTGIVNASYAEVAEQIGTRNVRERVYRGICADMQYLPGILQQFNLKQFDIYGVFQNQPGLSDKEKERVVKYLDEFYKIINDPGQTRRYIERDCRKVGS
jgi:hypothetical protein